MVDLVEQYFGPFLVFLVVQSTTRETHRFSTKKDTYDLGAAHVPAMSCESLASMLLLWLRGGVGHGRA